MIFFVTLLGFILAALIFVYRKERYGSNFYLALFIFFNSFYAVTSFSFISNEFRIIIAQIYPYVIIPNMASGPFLYLCFLSVFKPNFKFKRIHLVHFLPALFFFVNGSDYLFWDPAEKARLIKTFMEDSQVVFSMPTLLIPYYFHVLFRMVQTLSYVLASVYLFWVSFKLNGYRFLSDKIPYTYYIFFLLFFIGHFCTTLIIGVRLNPSFDELLGDKNQLDVLLLSSRMFFTLFIVTTLFNPKVVFEKFFQPIPATKKTVANTLKVPTDPRESTKYEFEELNRAFDLYMLEKPYLQPGYSLSQVADYLKIPAYYISSYIKSRYQLSFNDWKNEMRVRYAIELLLAGEAKYSTLESISIQCGYRSRTNFIESFKKVVGCTPSEYLINLRNLG